MTLNIPANYAVCALHFDCLGDSETMTSTVGIGDGSTTINQASAVEIADNFQNAFGTGDILQDYTFRGLTLTVGTGVPGSHVIIEEPRFFPGIATAAALPPNCAYLIRKSTAIGGRSGRGRMYLPPFFAGESAVTAAGFLTAFDTGVLQARFREWSDTLEAVLLHDSTSPVTAPTPITAFTLERQLATQRRRLRR